MIKKGRLQKSEQPAWLHALLCFCLVALGLRAPHWPLGEALDQGEVESWGFWKKIGSKKLRVLLFWSRFATCNFVEFLLFAQEKQLWCCTHDRFAREVCGHITATWLSESARDVAFCRISEDNIRISANHAMPYLEGFWYVRWVTS